MNDEAMKTQGALAGSLNQPMREKTWDECSQDEKMEMLRRYLRITMDQLCHVSQIAGAARDMAQEHQHAQSGQAMLPPSRNYAQAESLGRRRHNPLD